MDGFTAAVITIIVVLGATFTAGNMFRSVSFAEVQANLDHCSQSGGTLVVFNQRNVTCLINGHELTAPNPFNP